ASRHWDEETIRRLSDEFGRGDLRPCGDDGEENGKHEHVPEFAEVAAEAPQGFADVAGLACILFEEVAAHHAAPPEVDLSLRGCSLPEAIPSLPGDCFAASLLAIIWEVLLIVFMFVYQYL